MWAQTGVTSSNDAYATATASGNVAASKIELFIEQIATATTAKSINSLGAANEETKYSNIANGQAKAGTFSMFLDGKEYGIEVKEEDTLGDIIEKINTEKIELEIKKTICNATMVRQEETKELAKKVDAMIIIGGKHSSNSNKLYEISKKYI